MTWFAVGIASPEGKAMLTDDFVWRAPESMKHLSAAVRVSCGGLTGLTSCAQPTLVDALQLSVSGRSSYDSECRTVETVVGHDLLKWFAGELLHLTHGPP